MSRLQAESFPLLVLRRNRTRKKFRLRELMRCAEQFSPRMETIASPEEESCGATLVLDVSGSERLLGSPSQIAASLHRAASTLECAARYEASVAASHNACAALLAARGIPGVTAIASGCEAETLAPLPLGVLEPDAAQAQTLAAWGIHTLGQLAALPTRALAARLGQSGLHLQAQARAEHNHLLLPTQEPADAVLSETMEMEHPVELLEPLLFLLSHMLEQVLQRAAQRALAIAAVETCLVLDGNTLDATAPGSAANQAGRHEHRRTVRPALPERDRRTLLKLLQLDLELHPPPGAVVALRIAAHPARPQVAQPGLFAAQAPEAGRMEILLARLRKLVGEGRVGLRSYWTRMLPSHSGLPALTLARLFCPAAPSARCRRRPPWQSRLQPNLAATLRPCAYCVRPAVAIQLRGDTPSAMYYEGQRLLLQASLRPLAQQRSLVDTSCLVPRRVGCRHRRRTAALSAPGVRSRRWRVRGNRCRSGRRRWRVRGNRRRSGRRRWRVRGNRRRSGRRRRRVRGNRRRSGRRRWRLLVRHWNLRLSGAMYVELHARSAFSFLEGASLPEMLMARCAAAEMPAMALLDRNGLYGAPRFHIAAEKLARARTLEPRSRCVMPASVCPPEWLPHCVPAEPVRFALLAESQTGYQNLCRLITRYKLREAQRPKALQCWQTFRSSPTG